MPTIFLFHGTLGSPTENWFPWLKEKLEKEGTNVIVPRFPHPDHPQLEKWMNHFKQYRPCLDSQSILIGHSLGAAFALRLLEALHHGIKSTFLIAPVWRTTSANKYAPLIASFTETPFDWTRIRRNAGDIHILCSGNDPYLPLPYMEELGKELLTDATVIEGGGHFNTAAGYRTFPELLNMISVT